VIPFKLSKHLPMTQQLFLSVYFLPIHEASQGGVTLSPLYN
jgi:hypothetical protein